MTKKIVLIIVIILIIVVAVVVFINRDRMFTRNNTIASINNANTNNNNSTLIQNTANNETTTSNTPDNSLGYIEESNDIQNGFRIDSVLHTGSRDIHFSSYIPSNIDSNTEIPLYITLPGYEGLYFQGVGVNLESEDFAEEARRINPNMIILAPQLDDWGETSANDTISLIEYFKGNYNISKVYANGYSGGGETMSLVMGKRADLIDGYLQVSSRWDGDYEKTVENETPVYFFIGEGDEYYGSEPTKEAYNTLYSMYQEKGLTDEQIDNILILDVRDEKYFRDQGYPNQHGGGGAAAHEEDIMNWLLTR